MFERFSEDAKRAVFFARWQAGLEAASAINTLHLLRGALTADPELEANFGSAFADQTGSDPLQTIDPTTMPRSKTMSEPLPLSENSKKALSLALDSAKAACRGMVACRDLVTAVCQIQHSSAAKALEPYAELMQLLNEGPETDRRIPVLLLGVGGVGRALIRQILELRDSHYSTSLLVFLIRLVADSEAVLASEKNALPDEELQRIVQLKADGGSLARESGARAWPEGRASILAHAKPGSIIVDCSATADMAPLLAGLVRSGAGLVLANKKPLTEAQQLFDFIAGRERPPLRCRWESTVGAGLPVIATLNRLCACGDSVERVSGSLSSTLGYLMTGLQEGHRFSELVHEVMRAGYTEPDPREDLRGSDVARKAVIMARTLGRTAGLEEVEVERLFPAEMDELSVADFVRRLPRLDADYRTRCQAAAERGNVLRYLAEVSEEELRVGLAEVELDSPLGRLTGTNQLVQIHSRWYQPDPLVIQGRGAGVEATAAGVLADMVELALHLSP